MIFSLSHAEDMLDTTSYCKVFAIMVFWFKINGHIPSTRRKVFWCWYHCLAQKRTVIWDV